MVALQRFAFGETPVYSDKLNAFIDAWNGNTGGVSQGNYPLSVTAINDPVAYAGAFKNSDSGSKALIAYNSASGVLLQADSSGVKVSPDGTSAPTTAVVVAGVQTISGQKTFSGGIVASGGITGSGAIDISGATSIKGVPPQYNLLVNGGLEVWQRGVAFSGNGILTADRWVMQTIGTDAFSVQRDTANRDVGSVACAFLSFTLGTGGGSSGIYQQLKTSESQIAGKTISASMRIKTTLANAVRFQLSSDGTGAVAVLSGFHTGGGVYQTLTASYAVPADATVVQIQILLSAGTTQAFYVDNTMLVISPVPVDYAPLVPADDLARCMRYYQRFTAPALTTHVAVGQCYATTQAAVRLPLLAPMGGQPTLTFSAVGDWGIGVAGLSSYTVCTALAFFATPTGQAATVAATVGTATLVAGNAALLASTVANAWIAMEWNP